MVKIQDVKSVHLLKETDFRKSDEQFHKTYYDESSSFHMRFVESLTSGEMTINGRYVFLQKNDVILISSPKEVLIKNLNHPTKLAVYSEIVRAPSPLNLVVVGDNPMVHDLMNAGEDEPRFIVYRNQGDTLKKHYFELLADIESQDLSDPFLQFQREMVVGLLLSELLRNHRPTISISDSFFPGRDIHHAGKDTQAGIIFNYLVDHSRGATLKDTAAFFGYEKNYFSRLCRQLFGVSFTEQLAIIRIELAKRMLSLSNKNIDEIGYELGYKNLSSFFAIFKRSCELTPNEYRRKYSYKSEAFTSDNQLG
ncbi:helix-turn-helix domain-containing protein [Secundilactobacillus collinoides]|uniref:Transcriptional regulator n=2 Tax=Secundilactobacillus collinoides TaxID=33960 RepID=A0A0R2BDT3_SECCO|nr:AraC family transcriptional regulator [Secundilactobacillus collinoides]KRM77693.1 transcriptional regulator [Secundilactobacillus collinoides DSM 20515 = JCM 1123]KZL38877.1 AraC family transcriptional regulator [Secundilactobacillus collinoides]